MHRDEVVWLGKIDRDKTGLNIASQKLRQCSVQNVEISSVRLMLMPIAAEYKTFTKKIVRQIIVEIAHAWKRKKNREANMPTPRFYAFFAGAFFFAAFFLATDITSGF